LLSRAIHTLRTRIVSARASRWMGFAVMN
jgi:hypothetical protein